MSDEFNFVIALKLLGYWECRCIVYWGSHNYNFSWMNQAAAIFAIHEIEKQLIRNLFTFLYSYLAREKLLERTWKEYHFVKNNRKEHTASTWCTTPYSPPTKFWRSNRPPTGNSSRKSDFSRHWWPGRIAPWILQPIFQPAFFPSGFPKLPCLKDP